MPKAVDITGQRFGRLIARERAADVIYSGRPFTAWRCDCGASSVATASRLTRGLTKSCGCLRRETGKFKAVDLTGERFGRLTVVRRVGSRHGKALWACDCDCGTRGHDTTQNQLQRGHAQSCGCFREEFLTLGPKKCQTGRQPQAVPITFPIPETLHHNPFVNEVMRRRYEYRWQRVEFEARQIERGNWKEPKRVTFVPRVDRGRPIIPLDLRGMMRERGAERRAQVEDTPASFNTGSSLADRVRVLTDEEWARL